MSCKKFVDIQGPKGKQDIIATFNNQGAATAAVLDLYAQYEPNIVYSNASAGLASDEMVSDDAFYAEFQNNSIAPLSFTNDTYLWATYFFEIRRCNLAIQGLTTSTGLTQPVKDQLLGEALFMRAYMFITMLNLYGGIPLTVSPVEKDNAMLPRSTPDEVWTQIFSDLQKAKSILKTEYPSAGRARVNRYAASALLARAYLYHKDWAKAETEASEVIDSKTYGLVNPDLTFKNNSNETIFQLATQNGISSITVMYVPLNPATTPEFYLRNGFDQAFEKNAGGGDDSRKTNWTKTNNNGLLFINKYKLPVGTGDEYTILLRLGELYLIRAEARANQAKLNGENSAEQDLNMIRTRAGLTGKFNLDKTAVLKAIEQERKVELFGEYMHRWFDLKRTQGFTTPSKSRADEVLSVVKGSFWQPEDVLFPIPASQLTLNTALTPNPGY